MLTQQEISDHIEIGQLIHRYARGIDTKDFDLLASVFTPDALIHYDVGQGVKLNFPDMMDWLKSALQIFAATHHVMTNPMIEVKGDTARSTTYLTASHVQVRKDGKEAIVIQGGMYIDVHVRTEDGWRIQQRTLRDVYVNGTFLSPKEVQLFAKPRG